MCYAHLVKCNAGCLPACLEAVATATIVCICVSFPQCLFITIWFGLVWFGWLFVCERLLLVITLFTISILSHSFIVVSFFPRELCWYEQLCVCVSVCEWLYTSSLIYSRVIVVAAATTATDDDDDDMPSCWNEKRASIIRHDYANCSLFIANLANDSPISIEIHI